MSDLAAFLQLGFRHITDPAAIDHILFLLALAAVYRPAEWRGALLVISAFTMGHSITLALAVTSAVQLPTPLIEFLIPVTIVVTGATNLRGEGVGRGIDRPLLAGGFGLVHGAGFANYLRHLFAGSIATPLFGFNLGIELGQLVVLALAALLLTVLDRLLDRARAAGWPSAYRLRVLAVSAAVAGAGAGMAIARRPW
jgi:hypothetical protein